MTILKNAELPRAALPGIEHVTLAGSQNGLKHLSVWSQHIEPGGATPPHRHDCEEVVLIRSGSGELHLGGEVHQFNADTTLVVPRNAEHQIINTGVGSMELVGIFSTSPVEVFLPDGQAIELPWVS
ncbi:MAG: cupin domain-containing protein [Rhodospirillaceae bacterium]|jgi:mannose-6-phosphate isomerase-like protein (cupin superfamily)|nr:cupin domain-containing protein [Rhodospirillaceae bacterium]MBT6136431.1 cupin domain-containing protein [Rhodospirillaceae bacterium]